MLDKLKNKIECWTAERIDNDFYQGLPTHHDRNMKYVIERDDTGFFVTQRDSATYFNLKTGVVNRVDCRWNNIDPKCNEDLYHRSVITGEFFVDKPLDNQFLTINKKLHWYSVVQRPFNNLGVDCNMDIGLKIIDEQYIKEWIDHTTIVLKNIKEVVKKNNAGYPANGVLLTHRLRIGDIYSWKTFKRWQRDCDSAIEKTIDTLRDFQLASIYLMNGGEITPELVKMVQQQHNNSQTYAREQWSILTNQ
jgi:hypothetical protein